MGERYKVKVPVEETEERGEFMVDHGNRHNECFTFPSNSRWQLIAVR